MPQTESTTEEQKPKKQKSWPWILLSGGLAVIAVIAFIGWGCEKTKVKPPETRTIYYGLSRYGPWPPVYLDGSKPSPWVSDSSVGTGSVEAPDTEWIRTAHISWFWIDGSQGRAMIGFVDSLGNFDTTGFKIPAFDFAFYGHNANGVPSLSHISLGLPSKKWSVDVELLGGVSFFSSPWADNLQVSPMVKAAARFNLGPYPLGSRRMVLTVIPFEAWVLFPDTRAGLSAGLRLTF